MAGSSLCVSCAALPIKERGTAARTQRCPRCAAQIGVTSYGAAFRMPAAAQRSRLTPDLVQNMLIGVGIGVVVLALTGIGIWMHDAASPARPLPANPAAFAGQTIDRHPRVIAADIPAELRGIPEVALADYPRGMTPAQAKQNTHQLIQTIRQENAAKKDGFLLALMERRPEVQGLPFQLGDGCKLGDERGKSLQQAVLAVRTALDANPKKPFAADVHSDAGIAAYAQILGPESADVRTGLTRQLANSHLPAASRELAKAAIFDTDGDVRAAALKALKDRPPAEYRDVLMHGMRYPMPAISRRAAQAIIILKRTDVLPALADMLAEPAPGDPAPAMIDNAAVHVVREVVRINHHRNCLLCHAPVDTGTSAEVPGLMPTPGLPFPTTTREYYGEQLVINEPAVRADTTYLRQDFSVMLPVADAAPWPEKQRFDFLVRTRKVEGAELARLQAQIAERPAGHLSENQKAALTALRELTGQNADPTPQAWRQVLAKN